MILVSSWRLMMVVVRWRLVDHSASKSELTSESRYEEGSLLIWGKTEVSGGVPFLMNTCLIFVYICGVIGHVYRACCKKLGKDEPAPYSKVLTQNMAF